MSVGTGTVVTSLRPAPGLADVLADPSMLDGLPLDALIGLRRQLRVFDADLDASLTRHMMRGADHQSSQAEGERLLSPYEAATMFSVKPRWLLEHADEIPGTRRLSRKVIRFSPRGLRRHLSGLKA